MELFDKVKHTFADTKKIVAQKAKDVAELTKLKSQIAAEENAIQKAYLSIGKRFYEENMGEVSEAYISDFTRINESKAKIQDYQDQLKVVKGMYHCPNCGAEIPVMASFCSSCGQKLNPPILTEDKPSSVEYSTCSEEE